MNKKRTITILVSLIVVLSAVTTLMGILSDDGPGSFIHESIRGKMVEIYGKGIYKHMSSDVAIQGIAQDYVTLFIGIPLLIISLVGYRKNFKKSYFLLSGTLGYFFVTFLFYTAMGMYNEMFLLYVSLLGLSFFALITALLSPDLSKITENFSTRTPVKGVGGFLMANSILIGLLWLSKVIPPLIDGSIYPEDLYHYTTLIVQGFDLGLLLPMSFVTGLLLTKRKPLGYLTGTTYIVFLAILMTALTAKIVAMAINDVNVIPVIFIIPAINLITIICAILMIRNFGKENHAINY